MNKNDLQLLKNDKRIQSAKIKGDVLVVKTIDLWYYNVDMSQRVRQGELTIEIDLDGSVGASLSYLHGIKITGSKRKQYTSPWHHTR